MTSQTEQQIVLIYILLNISRSIDNQSLKYGQLIEHNMWNIFLAKSSANWTDEASPRLFIQNKK